MGLFYLCTGFHRSGTSLLAQTLQSNGVDMGIDLMGATYSNPLGHVEDMPMVRLHDKIYRLNGADWRYHDSSPLIKPVWLPNYIKHYLQQRKEKATSNMLAGKDPRAVHFLKEWKVAAGKNIKFIFIYRHWREACFSLLNRHSRHFLNTAHPMAKAQANLDFWAQPDLAFKMWLSANKRILEFYQANRDDCILMSQEEFVRLSSRSEFSPLNEIAEKIGLKGEQFYAKTLKASLLTNFVPTYADNGISKALASDLEALYSGLQESADLSSISIIQSSDTDSAIHKTLYSSLKTANSIESNNGGSKSDNIFKDAEFDFSELLWSEFSGTLLRLPIRRLSPKPFRAALRRDVDFPHHESQVTHETSTLSRAQDYYSLAKVAHYKGVFLVCYVFQMRAMMCDALEAGKLSYEQAFRLSEWSMFCADLKNWSRLPEQDLPGDNPFKKHLANNLSDFYKESVPHFASISKLSFSDMFENQALPTALETHVWLMTSQSNSRTFENDEVTSSQYMRIAQMYEQDIEIVEFCLFKAMLFQQIQIHMHQSVETYARLLTQFFSFYAKHALFEYAMLALKALTRTEHMFDTEVFAAVENCIVSLIESLEFTWTKRYISVLSAQEAFSELCRSLNHTLSLQQDALKPARGLKHRFALQAHSIPYDKILEVGERDSGKGHQLDLLNRRLSFLGSDKTEWLAHGTSTLTNHSKTCLINLLEKHWRRLWPKEVYTYFFDNTLPDIHTIENKAKDNHPLVVNDRIQLLVYVQNINSFIVFISLFKALGEQARLLCLVDHNSNLNTQQIEDVLARFSINGAKVQKTHHALWQANLIELSSMISKDNIDFLGLIACSKKESHIEKLRQLNTWYAMLGYEYGLRALENLDAIHLVVPNYHPQDLHNIQEKPIFYPVMHMAWLSTETLEIIHKLTSKGDDAFFKQLLVWLKKRSEGHRGIEMSYEVFVNF